MSSPEKPPWASMSVKARGEWVEVVFNAKVAALGLSVSKPYGDNQQFDFLVCDHAGKPVKVQVRSAWSKSPDHGYTVQIRHRVQRIVLGFDVLVAYIPPHDAWYVVPASSIGPGLMTMSVWPDALGGSLSRWEEYRSAWRHLSGDPEDDNRLLGITIHAAADDGKKSKLP